MDGQTTVESSRQDPIELIGSVLVDSHGGKLLSKDRSMYRVLVRASSVTYATNALTFDSVESAHEYAQGLACRWFALQAWAVVPVSLEPDEGPYWTPDYVKANALDSFEY